MPRGVDAGETTHSENFMNITGKDDAQQCHDDGRDHYVLELVGVSGGGERPAIRMLALDRDGNALYVDNVDDKGGFRLPHEALRCAHRIVFGAWGAAEGICEQTAIRMRTSEFTQRLRHGRLLLALR
jgi:hypothetical protein